MDLSKILSTIFLLALGHLGNGQATCSTPVDVVFLVLSHGSMMDYEYTLEKSFVIDTAKRLGLAPGNTQAAVFQYGETASVKARFGQYTTMAKFTEAVNALRHVYDGLRRLDKGLRVARSELSRGGRKYVPKLVLLIINGLTYADGNVLRQSYQPLRNDGVYVVAVGTQYSLKRELQLVTETDDDIIMVKDFRNLKSDVGKIISRACYLINKCASNPCQNGAKCVNIVKNYRCDCKPGYSGRNCETNINECASAPCSNGGTCVDLVARYRCDCRMGYSGKNCEAGDGCMSLSVGDQAFDKDVDFVPMSWFETPSIVHDGTGGYEILGRHVHMDFTQEHLKAKKKINIGDTQASPNNIRLKILADTVYVKGNLKIKGIKKLTILSRRVVFVKGSQLDLSAPNLSQRFAGNLPAGANGGNGKQGANGPTVEIYADLLEGYVNILTNGGNGLKGQDGANGRRGTSSSHEQADRSSYKKVQGKAALKTCPGKGAAAAESGKGGAGGQGGRGGHGVKCRYEKKCRHGFVSSNCWDECLPDGVTDEASRGPNGRKGNDGRAGTAGSDGYLVAPYIQKSPFGESEMKKYPLALLKLMTRYAEDLIWANKISSSEAVLNFVIQLTQGREEASYLRKVAKRRLYFLNKEGFDRFGKNKMYAPLMKWDAIKKKMTIMKDRAKSYEDAYNSIRTSIEDEISELRNLLPNATLIQVRKKREQVVEDRRVAISQKGTYVAAIGELEASMNSSLAAIDVLVSSVYEKSKFNKVDLFAILQGVTGFLKEVKGKDPLAAINEALGVIGHFTTKCNSGTLQSIKDKISKWMTFGKAYTALKDSSDLDFDQMDVTAVPEMMKANLEMNKKSLATDLVCMLDERSLPRDKAKLEELIDRFFIAGSTRIDLIGKVLELDNGIGGFNFHIRNLNETANDIEKLFDSEGSQIEDTVKQMLLDDLLTSYQEIETGFADSLYQLYKSFEFRSLWDESDKLAAFQRRASEAAKGTGKLEGIVELTNAMLEVDKLESKAQDCFSRMHYSTNTHKWSFDNVKDKVMFSEIHEGKTKFSLHISDSCKQCYNVRLLKMYVELYGDNTQNGNYPSKVYLKLRHMTSSQFRDGNGDIREFRQVLGSLRKFEFNRFAITNTTKCNEEKKKGNKDSSYCMPKDDGRFQPMCCHFLSDSPCDDKLLGAVECKSPFGTYELTIPIDNDAPCKASETMITHANCKDYDRSQLTKMNVWIHYMYWTDKYPTGPKDVRCGSSISRSPPRAPAEYIEPSLNTVHEA
ncbi:uncharacterized protein LOC144642139 [Oculina patagonica]